MQIIWKDKIKSKSMILDLEEYTQVSPPSLPSNWSSSLNTEWHDWNEMLRQP